MFITSLRNELITPLDDQERPGFSKKVPQARSASSPNSRSELTAGGSAVEGISTDTPRKHNRRHKEGISKGQKAGCRVSALSALGRNIRYVRAVQSRQFRA